MKMGSGGICEVGEKRLLLQKSQAEGSYKYVHGGFAHGNSKSFYGAFPFLIGRTGGCGPTALWRDPANAKISMRLARRSRSTCRDQESEKRGSRSDLEEGLFLIQRSWQCPSALWNDLGPAGQAQKAPEATRSARLRSQLCCAPTAASPATRSSYCGTSRVRGRISVRATSPLPSNRPSGEVRLKSSIRQRQKLPSMNPIKVPSWSSGPHFEPDHVSHSHILLSSLSHISYK